MSMHINNNKLLEKYKTIWTKIEDLKNIELDALPVYDDRYIKVKTYIVIKFTQIFLVEMFWKMA